MTRDLDTGAESLSFVKYTDTLNKYVREGVQCPVSGECRANPAKAMEFLLPSIGSQAIDASGTSSSSTFFPPVQETPSSTSVSSIVSEQTQVNTTRDSKALPLGSIAKQPQVQNQTQAVHTRHRPLTQK